MRERRKIGAALSKSLIEKYLNGRGWYKDGKKAAFNFIRFQRR